MFWDYKAEIRETEVADNLMLLIIIVYIVLILLSQWLADRDSFLGNK